MGTHYDSHHCTYHYSVGSLFSSSCFAIFINALILLRFFILALACDLMPFIQLYSFDHIPSSFSWGLRFVDYPTFTYITTKPFIWRNTLLLFQLYMPASGPHSP